VNERSHLLIVLKRDGRIANRLRHRHQLRLLATCTNCETPFPIPALWVEGECPHCFLPFATMAKRQKSRRADFARE
jgi:hypothetical protein